MSRRPSWTVVLTDSGFAAIPLGDVEKRVKRMHKQHAIDLAAKMNSDAITADVARRFGAEVVQ